LPFFWCSSVHLLSNLLFKIVNQAENKEFFDADEYINILSGNEILCVLEFQSITNSVAEWMYCAA